MSSFYLKIYDDLVKFTDFCDLNKILSFITYNTVGGKGYRAELFNLIISDINSTELSLKTSCVYELLQSAFIVADDVMDESLIRRGVECYYRKKGLICLKYAQYLISALGKYLRMVRGENERSPLRATYYNCILDTCLGQILDSKKKSKEEYSVELYNRIIEYKTAIYTFYLPLVSGYLFSGRKEPSCLYEYCKIIGMIFQMQDDYLNFFPELSKKSGNDLEEKKLTYFTCKLVKEDSEEVNEYFRTGIVSEEILKIVKGYFNIYNEEINKLIAKAEEMNDVTDSKVHNLLISLLKKRQFNK
ncbi:hypothetical protein NCER_101910 [Vairimorpha ceranae BRL01]|uniref:Farnesyl pyrophosphate synthetase n=1 Tax=Vairimorpha ceranae (strain BRL01) TaxID=578460 RepID=C4VB01_VAIC1|nr:hypothetical protein NCER_101910 [Vairimorpha ceranae BRL01]